jgi:S-adenosyl-L-methionine hydrolase (adenosine-forming)
MVIALLTDFGTRDHFAAAMKGVILTINPTVTIIDITHEIEPQDIRSAAFTLFACYKEFPAGTVFTVVVDPGVGSKRRAIAASSGGYYFVAPDNGVLSFVLAGDAKIVELNQPDYFAEHVSHTFHGRDIFAPVAAHLSKGVWLAEFGPYVDDPVLFELPKPETTGGNAIGEIIHIDRFGNLITNLTTGNLPPTFVVEINGQTIDRYCEYYAEADEGELFTILGSAGFLEIVVNRGCAQQALAAKTGDRVRVAAKDMGGKTN